MHSALRSFYFRSIRMTAAALLLGAVMVLEGLGAEPSVEGWPRFRGPNGSGVAPSARPPVAVGPETNVLWRVEVPWSPSSPCVQGERLFLTTFAEGKLETRAYATEDGRLLWSRAVAAEVLEKFHPQFGSPAASTPATDGERVVSYFGSFGLVAYDLEGKELWRQRLPVAETHGDFGSGVSPMLAGERVILNRDLVRGSVIMAFDLTSGRKLWETSRAELPTSYGTPILWTHDGLTELVVPGSISLRAYDPETGAERWQVKGMPSATCTSPVLGEGLLFFAGWAPGKADSPFPSWAQLLQADRNGDGALAAEETPGELAFVQSVDADGNGKVEESEWTVVVEMMKLGDNRLVAVRPGGKGDITQSHVVWEVRRGLPYVPSALYYEGLVYTIKDGGLISAYEAETGTTVYQQERVPGAAGGYYASPVAAAGRLYLGSLNGMLTVIQAGGERPVLLHQADFGEAIDATPALVGDRLYLRTRSKLFSFGSSR